VLGRPPQDPHTGHCDFCWTPFDNHRPQSNRNLYMGEENVFFKLEIGVIVKTSKVPALCCELFALNFLKLGLH
jgi:hypothetical protein